MNALIGLKLFLLKLIIYKINFNKFAIIKA